MLQPIRSITTLPVGLSQPAKSHKPSDLPTALRYFEDRAHTSFLSLGKGGYRIIAWGIFSSYYIYPWFNPLRGLGLWVAKKLYGLVQEHIAIKYVNQQLITPRDKETLNLEIKKMDPAAALRLSQAHGSGLVRENLSKQNKITLAVEYFKKNYASFKKNLISRLVSRLFSLGNAGKAFFALAAGSAFPLKELFDNAEQNTVKTYFTLILPLLWLFSKFIIGLPTQIITGRVITKKLAGLIKTEEDKALLKENMQRITPAQEKKLIKKLGNRGIAI